MKIRTLLMLFITCNALSIYNCFSMEKEGTVSFVLINNGLLTRITATTIKTYSAICEYTPSLSSTLQLQNNTLINLMQGKSSEHQKQRHYSGPYYRYKCHEIFRPIIIEKSGNYFINLGQFNNKTHKEAKEAIRQNKAVYSRIGQGVIIYNLDQQPDPEQWTTDELKEFIQILQENNEDI